jgi:hypothetical protein
VRRLTLLKRGVGAEVARWAALVRGSRGPSAGERLRAAARSNDRLAQLVTALESAPSRDAGIAELNDQALELDRVLDVGAEIPRSAARIALFSGTACAIGVVMTSLDQPGYVVAAALSFSCGLVGAFGCTLIGRAAREHVQSQRQAWTELGRTLARVLPGSS